MIYPKTIPRSCFASSKVIPEYYKFVHLDNVDKSGDDLPRFSMHRWMYSTFIRRPISSINSEKTGVGKV